MKKFLLAALFAFVATFTVAPIAYANGSVGAADSSDHGSGKGGHDGHGDHGGKGGHDKGGDEGHGHGKGDGHGNGHGGGKGDGHGKGDDHDGHDGDKGDDNGDGDNGGDDNGSGDDNGNDDGNTGGDTNSDNDGDAPVAGPPGDAGTPSVGNVGGNEGGEPYVAPYGDRFCVVGAEKVRLTEQSYVGIRDRELPVQGQFRGGLAWIVQDLGNRTVCISDVEQAPPGMVLSDEYRGGKYK